MLVRCPFQDAKQKFICIELYYEWKVPMPAQLSFVNTSISGLRVVQRKPIKDDRGAFIRMFCAKEFKEIGLTKPIVQINRSVNRHKGMVRGLHFQYPPFAETKIVSCLKGEIMDVVVDLRQGSETFLHWHGEVLSDENERALFIPEGFAHGFQTLGDDCELLYLHTEYYSREKEGALNVLDPRLNISWPLPIFELSQRDRDHPFMDEKFSGVNI